MNIRAQIFGQPERSEPILKAKQPKGVRADELHSIDSILAGSAAHFAPAVPAGMAGACQPYH